MIEQMESLTYGTLLKIQRLLANMTIRSAAAAAGVSHTYVQKIEQDSASPSPEHAKRFEKIFGLKPRRPSNPAASLRETTRQLCEKIVYPDGAFIEALHRSITKREQHYLKSADAVEYMIISLGCMAAVAFPDRLKANTFIRVLSKVLPKLSFVQRVHFHLFRGIISYRLGEYSPAITDLNYVMSVDLNTRHSSLVIHYLGRAHSDALNVISAERMFALCMRLCRETANFVRLSLAQHDDIVNTIRRGNIVLAARKIKLTQNGFHHKVNPKVHIKTQRLSVLIDLLSDRSERALSNVEKMNPKQIEDLFYKAWAGFLKSDETVLSDCDATAHKMANDSPLAAVHKAGINAFVSSFGRDAQKKENAFSLFYRTATAQRAIVEARIAYRLYTDFLSRKRRYKTMHKMNLEMISIMRSMMK